MSGFAWVGIAIGAIGAIACLVTSISRFAQGRTGAGVAYLLLTPAAFAVTAVVGAFAIAAALLVGLVYLVIIALSA